MLKPYQILMVIDSRAEQESCVRQLELDQTFTVLTERQDTQIAQVCQSQQIDGILLELSSPQYSRLDSLGQLKRQMGENCPPVVVIGNRDVEIAIQAFKNGATDYLVEEQMTIDDLRLTMRHAIENARIQQELQHSQEQFQTSVENMLDCFGIFSAMRDEAGQIVDFRIDYLNAAACENNRLPREAQIGRGLCEVLPGHRESGLFDEYCQLVETGEPLIKESLIYADNYYADNYGEQRLERAFDIRASKLNDGFVASWRDVTDRKLLELELSQTVATLQQHQNRLQRLIDNAPIGIGIGSANGEVKTINDEMLRLHGYTREEFEQYGMNWHHFTAPEFIDRIEPAMSRLRQEGFLPPEEKELLLRNGSRVPIWVSATQWVEGADEHVAFAIDLTRQKQAEATIQQLNQDLMHRVAELESLLDIIPIGIAIASDSTCTTMQCNAYLRQMLGVPSGVNISKSAPALEQPPYRVFQNGQELAAEDLPMQAAARLGIEVREAEFDILLSDGTVRQLLTYATPLQDAQNQIRGAVGAFVDITERNQFTVALQSSQQRYQELAEAMPQMVWTANATGAVNYWNSRWYEYTGLSEAESMGLAGVNAVHPEDCDRTLEEWGQSVSRQESFEIKYRVRRRDGVYRWFISRGLPIRNHQNQVTGWIGTITDVDDQTQLGERLRLVLQAVNGLIFDWNLETNSVYRSEKLFDIVGVHPEEVPPTASWWHDRIHPEDIARMQSRMQEMFAPVLKPLELVDSEYRVRHQDGHWVNVWERSCLLRNDRGRIVRIVGSTVDISDRKMAEARLRESEEHLRYTVELSSQSPWTATPTGELEGCSDRWLSMVGLTRSQALGEGWTQIVHPDDLPMMTAAWMHSVETGEPYDVEHRAKLADGSYLWMRSRAFPRRNEQGEIIRWYGTTEDIDDRKRSEEALRISEAQFRTIANAAPAFVWVCLATGEISFMNERWYEQTGQSLEDAAGFGWSDMMHPDDMARILPYWQRCCETGEPYEGEVRYRQKDGEYRWYRFRALPQRNSVGVIEKWFGCSVDIHDTKRIEEVIATNEAKLRGFVDANVVGMLYGDIYGNINDANDELLKIVGYTREDLQAGRLRWIDITPPESLPLDAQAIAEAQAKGACTPYEKEYIRKDGSRVPVLVGYSLVGEAREESVAFILDLSERKQAEADLQERNDHIQLLYETTRDLLSSTQPLTLLETIFEKLRTLTGLDVYLNYMLDEQQQKLRLAFYGGIGQEEAQAIEWLDVGQALCGTVAQERRQIVKVNIQDSSDPKLQLARSVGATACACQPLIAQGKLFGTVGFASRSRSEFTASEESLFRAICDQVAIALERAKLLTSLQQQTEELARVNRIKDEFLAVLSHELRSPLNPILGWTRLLQTRDFNAAKTAEALAIIERNAKLQTQLIDDLLDVAKILRGKLSMEMAAVDLTFVIEAAIDTVRGAATAKQIDLYTVLPQVGQVYGDVVRLQQVFWNLLSNAIKFTPAHGRVEIRLEQRDAQIQITVSDTGKGIKPEFLPHLFESFRQEDASTTRRFGGLGLGLAIVRHLVEAHGGTITADSLGEGLGSTFTVRLPFLNAEPEPQLIEVNAEQAPDLTGIRILTVDDEPDARDLLEVVLTQYGAEVITATSAAEVLAVLPSLKPNLLISDIGMPDVDGYSLVQQVRALPADQGGQTLAIALTAYAGESNQQRVIAAGFQKHISKPIDPETLVRAIVQLLRSA
ncbi:PAS domain S-box protein [Leptolyngbya ohadii]|uniref:PAS domain S-box protein n=1 Tax=Leptolyngbya ohadii TaxID=1962290 RepID=UPI0015C62DA4|nr:PAS domain S-box protein [Leptolyngbya ohadii]